MSFLLIDANSLGFAAQNSSRLSANNEPVQAIYYTLRMVKSAIEANPSYKHPIVLWDGKSKRRLSLFPEYKAKRKANPKMEEARKEYHRQRPEIVKALSYLGMTQIYPRDFEADDLAGYLVRKNAKAVKKTMLVSGDRDWLQLVNALTSWYDPRSTGTSVIDKSEFKGFTGFSSTQKFLQGKAILGDTSDCIDGVPGLGEKAAVAIMDQFGSVEGLIEDYQANGPFSKRKDLDKSLSRFRKKLDGLAGDESVQELFYRNMALMDLTQDEFDDEMAGDCRLLRSKPNLDKFVDFCGHHKFASILRNIDDWKF